MLIFLLFYFLNNNIINAADIEFLPTQFRSPKVLISIHDQYIKQKCLELAEEEMKCYATLPEKAVDEDWGGARGCKDGKNIALCKLVIDVQNRNDNSSINWCEIDIPARYSEYRTESSRLYRKPYIFMSSEEAALFEPFETFYTTKNNTFKVIKHHPLYEYQKDAQSFYTNKQRFCSQWSRDFCATNEGDGSKDRYDDTEQQIIRYIEFLLNVKDINKTNEIFNPLLMLLNEVNHLKDGIKFVCSILLHTRMSPCFFCFTNLNDFFSKKFPELIQNYIGEQSTIEIRPYVTFRKKYRSEHFILQLLTHTANETCEDFSVKKQIIWENEENHGGTISLLGHGIMLYAISEEDLSIYQQNKNLLYFKILEASI